jgi:tetratricopeptide (TPR) repeat protein
MAEDTQEEIVVIEESDASDIEIEEDIDVKEPMSDEKKKVILLVGISTLVAILFGVIIFLLLDKESDTVEESLEEVKEKLSKNTPINIEPSQLEKMIGKANYLYSNGNKEDALRLYEKIALYSEAISQYNLGVAQLKEQQYDVALNSFKNAIENGENRCVSALNAAVCSMHLDDKENFKYYIELAYAYLPYESASPLYSYYYALINYYKGNYLEALVALKNPSSDEYKEQSDYLSSKIYALYGDDYDSIVSLKESYKPDESFSLGLLYANVGDLSLARRYLERSIELSEPTLKKSLALAMIYIKSAQYDNAAKIIDALNDKYSDEIFKPYPIKVFLKDSLFNAANAQEHFRNSVLDTKSIMYQKIFYFSPYKVFNAAQTISYIRRGNANIYIDDINGAKEYLQKSARTSSINYGIAKAIQKSLSFELRDANKLLLELYSQHPKDSILLYNLALTYAQMNNMVKAHEYFLKSYHLDANNFLSGVFTILTAELINKDVTKFRNILKENLALEEPSEYLSLYKTLIDLSEGNYIGTSKWLEKKYDSRPLYLALNSIIASLLKRDKESIENAKKLSFQLPNDILPHLMYINEKLRDKTAPEYAIEAITYLKKQDFIYSDLYFGPYITRYLYTQMALITGQLYPLRENLKKKLETTTDNVADIMYTLALASIYDKEFEEAFVLFNQLIDDYKIRDELTFFLAAVASTGAKHHANAIALLELAKQKQKNNKEVRYALALLYMQVKNYNGSSLQLKYLGNSGFMSEYFNFMIDNDKLYFERNKKLKEKK